MLLLILMILLALICGYFYLKRSSELKTTQRQIAELEEALSSERERKEELVLELTQSNNRLNQPHARDIPNGLQNTLIFNDRLMQAIQQSKRHASLFGLTLLVIREWDHLKTTLAPDDFAKFFNEIALRLRMSVREIDAITCNPQSHFLFLLPHLTKPEVIAYVAQRIIANLIKPILIHGEPTVLSGNLGIVICPTDGGDGEALLKNVYTALYQAEKQGINTYHFYHPEMNAAGQRELQLSAFMHDPDFLNQVVVYYQPIIDINTNKIVYIHASPMLHHPTLGLVGFVEYRSVAENSGKLTLLGEWLLQHALTQIKEWRAQGLGVNTLVFNGSIRLLQDATFAERVVAIARDHHWEPEHLVCELVDHYATTSSVYLEKAIATLNHYTIQVMVGIYALSNFPLYHMTKLMIHYLKIDKKLIEGLLSQEKYATIVDMLVGFATDLKISTVAEDIDNEKQKQILANLGCKLMQGHLFLPPLKAEEFAASPLFKSSLSSLHQ